MYKVDYLTYHIGRCGSFQELIDLLRDQTIISYSGVEPKEYDFDKLCRIINSSGLLGKVNYCPRAHGFRAKVAELIMTFNYLDEIPEELGIEVRVKMTKTFWDVKDKPTDEHPVGEIILES